MADPLRYTIIEQLKTQLEGITVANGYRNDVTEVAVEARSFDDPEVRPDTMPWIGIIPQDEQWQDEPFHGILADWSFDVIAHFQITDRTALGVAEACMEWTHDIRKAVYAEQDLGIEGVIMVRATNRLGAEGSAEAAKMGLGSVMLRVIVQFEEETGDD